MPPNLNYLLDFKIFEATPGISLVIKNDPPLFSIVAVSNDFVHGTGFTRPEIIGKSYFKSLLVVHEDATNSNKEKIKASLDATITNKSTDELTVDQYNIANENNRYRLKFCRLKNVPVLNDAGEVIYIVHTLREITSTDHKETPVGDPARSYKFFMSAPVVIGYLRKEDFLIEFANEGLLRVWQKTKDVIGKPLFKVFPELEAQGVKALLEEVLRTGQPFFAYAYPLIFFRAGKEYTLYFDFVYQPFYENEDAIASGIISVGYDVTSQVIATRKIEESQKKWKQLADTMPAIVWTGDQDGNVNFLNQKWYEFTGLTEEKSLQSGWARVVHPDDLDRCMMLWDEARRKNAPFEMEVRCQAKNGEYRWMMARVIPIKEEEKVIAWYGTSSDIHEQKQLELHLEDKVRERTNELEGKNRLLDNILKHSSNGISVSKILFDSQGNVVDAVTIVANDSAVSFTGVPKELYLSKPASYFDPHIISSPYGQACVKTLRTGEPSVIQYFFEYSDKWLELTISKMDDSHLIHIFTDITPIKQAHLQLEKSLEDLRYSNANLEQFAYAASHDLKEPVRKIRLFADKLKQDLKEKLDEGQKKLFDRIENSSSRMVNLIDDLLSYSQAAEGSAEKEEINLETEIRSVMEDLELDIQKKNAKITIQTLPIVSGNRRLLQQLFQNLIDNALKYSKEGVASEINISSTIVKGKEVEKNIPLDRTGKSFHLIVISDNGIGFDPMDAERIFKIFTRLHSAGRYGGNGIGLSIVRKVVESHNGFIWAEGRPGVGATFKILLPV